MISTDLLYSATFRWLESRPGVNKKQLSTLYRTLLMKPDLKYTLEVHFISGESLTLRNFTKDAIYHDRETDAAYLLGSELEVTRYNIAHVVRVRAVFDPVASGVNENFGIEGAESDETA